MGIVAVTFDRCNICGRSTFGVDIEMEDGEAIFICNICIQEYYDAIAYINPLEYSDDE